MGNHVESENGSSSSLWRGLIPVILVSVFSTQPFIVDLFGDLCKPVALFLISCLGVVTDDMGSYFTVAHLEVPWTRDCAGMNLLLVLLFIFCWMNRNNKQNYSYWLRLCLVIFAAAAANVLRIMALVFYRYLVFPEVESPQLHYFFGLLCLVPFALIVIPNKGGLSRKKLWFEMLHIAVVAALISPLMNLSNHWITILGSILILLKSRYEPLNQRRELVALIVWFFSAVLISWLGIESLWLPWVLVCPLAIKMNWFLKPDGLICLLASCPLFILIPEADILGGLLLFYAIFKILKNKNASSDNLDLRLNKSLKVSVRVFVAILLFFPFLSAVAFNAELETLSPPETALKRVIKGMGFELKIKGQDQKLGLLWYHPQGSDRHHTIKVCLKYRGVDLVDSILPAVKTDGERWFREYFIVRGQMISDHGKYIWSTIGFRKDPGVHIIIVAKCKDFTLDDFATKAELTAKNLFESL